MVQAGRSQSGVPQAAMSSRVYAKQASRIGVTRGVPHKRVPQELHVSPRCRNFRRYRKMDGPPKIGGCEMLVYSHLG
jgi:hypothetical protein